MPSRVLSLVHHSFRLLAFARFCLFVSFFCGTLAAGQLPYLNGGPNSAFAQLDFAQAYLDERIWDTESNDQADVIDFSGVSALDLEAPNKAVRQFNEATELLRSQNFKEAIKRLQKAIAIYPKFVSAHNALGLAYMEEHDAPRAKDELQAAASMDAQFPGSLLNLGVLALWSNDFAAAVSNFEKAAALRSDDAKILTALAFAQNGDQEYQECLRTVEKVHALDHHGRANVHYIGAAAAMSLHNDSAVRAQLKLMLSEDSTSPLAPIARKEFLALSNPPQPVGRSASASTREDTTQSVTFPNSEHLQAQLADMKEHPDTDNCSICEEDPEPPRSSVDSDEAIPETPVASRSGNPFTIHQIVDETALFFSVSQHGRAVGDLSLSNIQILDDNKPPAKIVGFIPQSRLPLRLGLLIDTSTSVERRFSFEKRAAERFMDRILNPDSDLAFVAGFNTNVNVSQDFSADRVALAKAIDDLTNNGQTSVFDAVYYACWKLAAYPDEGRVARVLVILTDGEDNSSHSTLRQAIEEAEAAGVTVYAVSTAERPEGIIEKMGQGNASDKVLQALAERSGGQAMFPQDLRALDHYLSKLPEVIRNRYLLAYKPANFAPDGKYRTIAVTAEKDGKRLQVHVRKGYYARNSDE